MMKSKYYSIIFILFLLINCSGSEDEGSSSLLSSASVKEDEDAIRTNPNLKLTDSSFLFYLHNKTAGFFLFPSNNISIINVHFPISLLAADIIKCATIETPSIQKKAIIQATINANYKGDVSRIQNICSGEGSVITMVIGKQTYTIPTKELYEKNNLLKERRFTIPVIPYYFSSADDVITSENDSTVISLNISFLNRLNQKQITNCTYYTINDKKDPNCYEVHSALPAKSFYAKTWKSRHYKTLSTFMNRRSSNGTDAAIL